MLYLENFIFSDYAIYLENFIFSDYAISRIFNFSDYAISRISYKMTRRRTLLHKESPKVIQFTKKYLCGIRYLCLIIFGL